MKLRKIILLSLCLVALMACEKQPAEKETTVPEGRRAVAPISNLVESADAQEVKDALKGSLNAGDVDLFFDLVRDYNASVGKEHLPAAFGNNRAPVYDVGKIIDARAKSKAKAPDTNCRINTFLLLKDGLSVSRDLGIDDSILFMDKEALAARPLFNEEETDAFLRLFSRVKTDDSKDASHQGRVMEKALSKVAFPEKASMVSVVLHDNLDGSYLFIGHVGVLVKAGEGYVFVEKISFEEPYQAVKFSTKEACYAYLKERFKDYRDSNVAPPFLMDNGRYVGSVR